MYREDIRYSVNKKEDIIIPMNESVLRMFAKQALEEIKASRESHYQEKSKERGFLSSKLFN